MEHTPVIELFSIGTELILGQIQDTNAHWIAQQTLQLGGQLRRVTMLRDEFDEMIEAIEDSIRRKTELILTTGGLGPTPDDMTVEVVAKIIGKQPIVHEETLTSFIKRRQLTSRDDVNPAMVKMATVPETAEVFQNPVGWAPCISVTTDESTILMMPGPPREMKGIFETHIVPLIAERYSAKTATLRVYVSMFESEVSPILQQVMGKYPNVYLKAYVALRRADGQYMPVDLVSTGADDEDARGQLQGAVDCFRQLVTEKGKILSLEDE
ncbi:MAG: competence/damage-inducible protein A [Candidatus Poribacteria bacterium]|nr:competence/damage-inducible protein A [Candidatus Poribacteria bacterium]